MAKTGGPGPFGVLLQRHRVAAGRSQDELAEQVGLSQRGISDMERGTRRPPHMTGLARHASDHSDTDAARSLFTESLTLAREVSRLEHARALESLVELLATRGLAEPALQLACAAAGSRDAMRTPLWPTERARLDPALARARASLGTVDSDAAWRLGREATVDQTLALAFEVLQQRLVPTTVLQSLPVEI
jgi:transcriptional regulator with XRE-family HTH domain